MPTAALHLFWRHPGPTWQPAVRVALALVLYGLYLPCSGYEVRHIFFDAGEYWELSTRFFTGGALDFWGFRGAGRGYVGPLLLLPGRLLCRLTGCSILTASQAMGAGWAALLWGAVLPAAWRRAAGRPLGNGRWLALVGLGWALWRDYFNFPLTDFPGFTLLLLGLLALARPGPWCWLGAGAALAAALNLRPLYAAAVPAWLALAWYWGQAAGARPSQRGPDAGKAVASAGALGPARPHGAGREGFARWAALGLGVALVLGPQAVLNWRHAGTATPLVLVAQHDAHRDYLHALSWGTRVQRYETGFFPAGHRVLMVPDPTGIRELKALEPGGFRSYSGFLAYVAQHPGSVARRYARHLFNGLDLWYSSPYPRQVHPPGQAAEQLLNFGAVGLGLLHGLVVLLQWMKSKSRLSGVYVLIVGAAVLLPVLVALPSQVESRYFVALHVPLLLLAATARPLSWAGVGPPLRPRRLLLAGLLAGLWLAGCWRVSAAAQRQAEFDRFDLMP